MSETSVMSKSKIEQCPSCHSKDISFGELLFMGVEPEFSTLHCNLCNGDFALSSDGSRCIAVIL